MVPGPTNFSPSWVTIRASEPGECSPPLLLSARRACVSASLVRRVLASRSPRGSSPLGRLVVLRVMVLEGRLDRIDLAACGSHRRGQGRRSRRGGARCCACHDRSSWALAIRQATCPGGSCAARWSRREGSAGRQVRGRSQRRSCRGRCPPRPRPQNPLRA